MRIIKVLQVILRHPLNQKQKLRAVLFFIRWQLGIRLLGKRVVHSWIDKSSFYVGQGETGLTGNVYCGLHEFEDMAYLLHVIQPEDYFVDVGANVGSYTILAACVGGAHGCAIEAIPDTYRRLYANVRLNEIEKQLDLQNIAIGHESGVITFSAGLDTQNHVLAEHETSSDKIEVPVRALDEVLLGKKPSLIKIDVEGFETPVLQGASATLSEPSLHSVIMELNGSGLRYGYDESAILELMTTYGFKTYSYDPFTRKLIDLGGKNLLNRNTLFIRDIERVQGLIENARKYKVLGQEF